MAKNFPMSLPIRPLLTLPLAPRKPKEEWVKPENFEKNCQWLGLQEGDYFDYLNDKNIILIGPAGYYDESKEDLSKYDVVVRMNHGYAGKSRTDVLYINAHFLQQGNAEKYIPEFLKMKKTKWFIAKYKHNLKIANKLIPKNSTINIFAFSEKSWISWNRKINRYVPAGERMSSLNEGIIAILHLLESNLKTLAIRGFDFYESGYYLDYSPRYKGAMTPELIRKIIKDGTVGHDHQIQKIFLSHLVKQEKRLKIDVVLQRILNSAYPITDTKAGILKPISIVIPYKTNGSAHWKKILAWALERYKKVFPECQICIGENNDEPFNRAAAKNNGFKKAKHDLVLFTDLDALFERELLIKACEELEKTKSFVGLSGKSLCLSQTNTKKLLNSKIPLNKFVQQIEGTYVANFFLLTTKNNFEEVGGFDERFKNWGGEDYALTKGLILFFGVPELLEGRIFHMWHNVDYTIRQLHIDAVVSKNADKMPTAELELQYQNVKNKEDYTLLFKKYNI